MHTESLGEKISAGIAVLAITLYIVICLSVLSHCTTPPAHNRPNSLGVALFYDNPNIYLFAIPACGAGDNCSILTDSKGRKYTNLKFQPYNTASFYEEPVLFCGDVSGAFQDKRGVLIITYRRQATLNYQGIGCHDLTSVYEVPAPKEGGAQ
jgi:hypothetical protein